MPGWLQPNWQRVFVPTDPVPEIIVRGTIMYLATFFLLRVFRRQTGSLGPADLLVLLFIADAAQNGMADQYNSVTEGLILIGTIVFWEYTIDRLEFRFPWFRALCERPPLPLVEDGRVQKQHLRREMMTMDDLMSHLRQKGVDDVAKVRVSFLEGDGHISVLTSDAPNQSQSTEPVQPV